jgi:uncharacterized membrane protein YoaK (UPF0700 family)
MISKLPKWVWLGGMVLAFIAGMINAVGFLSFQHQGVTHLTGTTTLMSLAVASGQIGGALHLFGIIGAFVAGAIISGVIIQDSTLRLGRRYGFALVIESSMLLLAVFFLKRGSPAGNYLASSACGLQNAMVSTYSGAVLRTTHVSGLFTDIGIFIGHYLRRLPVVAARLRLWLALLFGFFLGGVAGAVLFEHLSYGTLYIPAFFTGAGGLIHWAYRHFIRNAAKPDVLRT